MKAIKKNNSTSVDKEKNNRKRTRIIAVASSIFICLVLGGAVFAYRHLTAGEPSLSTNTTDSGSGVAKTNTEDGKTSQPDTQSTNNSASKPATGSSTASSVAQPVTKNCVSQPVAYKVYYVRGTKYPTTGSNGYNYVCTYSDGRVITEYSHPATDEINYVNVSSTDYNTAYGMCSSVVRNQSHIDDCMKVVWGNF